MNRLERIQASFTKKSAPSFEIGDTVRVHVKVVEGEKNAFRCSRAVIARKGLLNTETFTGAKSLTASVWNGFSRSIRRSSRASRSCARARCVGLSCITSEEKRASLPRSRIGSSSRV